MWRSVGTRLYALPARRTAVLSRLLCTTRNLTHYSSTYRTALPNVHHNPVYATKITYRAFSTDKSLPPHKELGMPALSPTMTEGSIAKWKKNEGDKISAGDIIAEIETDKATIDFEAQDDGYLAKILAPSGSKDIPVNQAIAIVVDNQGDVEKFKSYENKPSPAKSQQPAPSKEAPSNASKPTQKDTGVVPPKPQTNYPPHMKLGMPALSPTMVQGDIAKWKKKPGDAVKVGESIAEIVTDKASMDFESQEDGFIAKILVEEGARDVPINTIIAVMVDKQSDISAFANFEANDAPQSAAPKQEVKEEVKEVTQEKRNQPSSKADGGRIAASPLARAIALEKGIDLSQLSGTGPNNRIIKADVLEFVPVPAKAKEQAKEQATSAAPKPSQAGTEFTDVPVSNIRKVTAQRLSLSKQTIPHYYLSMEVRVDQLQRLRTDLNSQANGKYKLSVNDFVIKAAALALQKVPTVNSSWHDQFIRRYNNIDINVAVNTDQGLFTPIVKDADKKGLAAIANSVKSLADKAKENKLQPAEFQGGTFTISNLGMFGISQFSAVINPPQAAILAVGGVERRLVPKGADSEEVEFANFMSVTLSCDHRVIDGAVGAGWLQAFKEYMESPTKMLL